MADMPIHRQGFSATQGRHAKARKILAILERAGHAVSRGQDILDLGTGSGHIALNLSQLGRVIACDVVDQRTVGKDLPFVQVADRLPFPDASFDLVVSNHVIEHVADPARQLAEIRRVLRPDGVAYLATPNRWWPWEVHTALPLLHYLPTTAFFRLARALGRSTEPLQLQSLASLRRHANNRFTVSTWHQKLLRNPAEYSLQIPLWAETLVRISPNWLIERTATMQPTLICLLRPR